MPAMKKVNNTLGMLTLILICLFSLLTLDGCGCSSDDEIPDQPLAPAVEPPKPVEQIALTITAAPNLNWEGNMPHPLSLCVYQLTNPGPFSTKAQKQEGVGELLSCAPFDATALSFERITLQPSSSARRTINREAGANYIGLVAGYYLFSRGQITTVFAIDNTAVRLHLGQYGLSVAKTGEKKPLN
ncbi:MAG: type VI secretion system lipoprotein TssJ [Pseudomonadota bacterium]